MNKDKDKEQSGVLKAWEATMRKTHAAKKRANIIFGTITMATAAEDDLENHHDKDNVSGEPYLVEKILPNGDYYTGQWYDNFPEGQGKYLWTDGCMYLGEWRKGQTTGKGRFSWPSGATYEGEFKSGYIDGIGIYTGPSGDTYKGQWVMNFKHGHGMRFYPNGDWYDGEWRNGLQEGLGKYQWQSENHYIGEWKNGMICGNGTFVWSNGNKYDGHWQEGWPKGNGTFYWPDGSYYVGNWSKDPEEHNGTYYPFESSEPATTDWDPQSVYTELADCKICPRENVSIMPSQKVLAWYTAKTDDNPRRLSIDGRASIGMERPDKMHMWESDDDSNDYVEPKRELDSEILCIQHQQHDDTNPKFNPELPLKVPKIGKRPGETISRGHKNYELMLNLQLGIRHSVGRPAPATSLDLKAAAFDPKEKFWTRFPTEGSKYTPPHQCCEFKWKDYCPVVFRAMRKLFQVDPADYMISICGTGALRELSSPGKSGSFFYLTEDDRYMIKTMKKSEVKVFIRMLFAYYNHVRNFENTLVIKYYGLHCVKLTGPIQRKVRFIIMGNLLRSEYTIHRRFDLKGSSLGRITDKSESEIDNTTILKDLDLNFIFKLQKSWFDEFCWQIDRDCEFLEQERTMDYSLLVGIHFKEIGANGEFIPCGSPSSSGNNENESTPPPEMEEQIQDPKRWGVIKLGTNMPARVERTIRKPESVFHLVGEQTGECYEVIMYFGIIDILQDYDITKRLEHAYKSIQYDPTSISAVDPKQYSKRFRDFIFKVFCEDTLTL